MSKPLAFGLNLAKKPGATSKLPPPKRKPMFGDDDDSDDGANGANGAAKVEEIGGELDTFGTSLSSTAPQESSSPRKGPKFKAGPPTQPPKLKSEAQPNAMFGDLSGSLTSRRNAEAAAEVDPSVYEYDAVYDSLKPKRSAASGGADKDDKRPRYMRGIMEAADVRKRDALIAEEKRIAREREAEGEEYADKEKFVTEAYRRQQEENKRIEEEEKRREEEEAKKNQTGGMAGFYRKLLNRNEQIHSDAVNAAESLAKDGPRQEGVGAEEETTEEQEEAKRIKQLNEKGAGIIVNEDGEVVDKRQLLKGGLNLAPKPKSAAPKQDTRPAERERKPVAAQPVGSKQAMRERQSRMMAEQLEQSMKRSREEAEAQRQEVERTAKSRKTEGEIMSAKERYLARKRAAEEAKKNGAAAD
ncbi:Nuclear speckle splicing regulatory protein-like protein [Hapsidospora chrysogenum ATCC 11550]|uniref:Nuclear speckle splicing regulatory protein-like protein n=1 Tax=Hapsidospora chrysogenum (strain ATCC 11550 / CBS 779.69 / DSM 880 / IAM 14645 / JCM 23072 / IMI 49137) TaxID=857340 RepID=A0A086THN9_HAPC1|nr:Nuclear speckle splicing regulatory protein-like protein [Hapsidospora chrysogenum ATCC 11550]